MEYHTGSRSLPLRGMVSFALRGSENNPPHSSPYPSRIEGVWRPPLSHISNVLSHTNSFHLCATVLQHLLLGHICGPLCHLNSGSRARLFVGHCWHVTVLLFCRWILLFVPPNKMKSRSVLLNFLLSLSSSLKETPGPFSLHKRINLPLHKGGALSYADKS